MRCKRFKQSVYDCEFSLPFSFIMQHSGTLKVARRAAVTKPKILVASSRAQLLTVTFFLPVSSGARVAIIVSDVQNFARVTCNNKVH